MAEQVLDEVDWWARRDAHHKRVDALLAGHLDRAARGEEHPIHDFLFTYYRIRPAQLRWWHPGLGVVLRGDPADLDDGDGYVSDSGTFCYDPRPAFAQRREGVDWIDRLLAATDARPGRWDCFGLHEWAMVYRLRQDQVRHPRLPLRLTPEQIAAVVEERGVRCTHVDAYRFFTPQARPLNQTALTRRDQLDRDQPGCLHVGMDLYKWAGKLAPACGSDLLLDCYELACALRVIDMRASPYDVSSLGYPPIRIETPAGRAEYAACQRELADRAVPLRRRLRAISAALLACLGPDCPEDERRRSARPEEPSPSRHGF